MPQSRQNTQLLHDIRGIRKDVERAFGVLQAHWYTMQGSALMWDPIDMNYLLKMCIILYNMIVDERPEDVEDLSSRDDEPIPNVIPLKGPTKKYMHFSSDEDAFEMKKCMYRTHLGRT